MKIDWKSKLASRKFWAAIVGFITLLVVAFTGNELIAEQIAAIVMAGATVIAYILGEAWVDASAMKSNLPEEIKREIRRDG